MYTDYQYYAKDYGGTKIPEESFPRAERWAEAYISKLTYLNGNILKSLLIL